MPITLEEPRTPGLPVVKRTALGQTFVGAIVDKQQRPLMKDNQPVLRDDGKPRQELVVTLVAMPGTTAPAGIGETTGTPAPGDLVRLILRGGAYGDWIEATRQLGRGINVGDVVEQTTTHGQAYSATGAPSGPKLTTQAQIDAVPRSQALGIYGPITIRAAAPGEASWVTAAESAYHARKQQAAIALDAAPSVDPF